MEERPILFSGPMVRAILAGTKTQTRRTVKFPKSGSIEGTTNSRTGIFTPYQCPYGVPGDRLWVKETWSLTTTPDGEKIVPLYAADYTAREYESLKPWKPSIFMPRRLSRITLEITGIRVERVQDISQADAIAEGTPPIKGLAERDAYQVLWESINGAESWAANPWVWVIEFKKV